MPEGDFLSMTKAQLPDSAIRLGTQRFCTDGRKSGEGVGAGTGVWVYADNQSGIVTWRVVGTDSEVTN